MSWYSKFKVAKVNGFDMLVDPQDDNISQILLNDGVWEKAGTEVVKRDLGFGTFVDCGAHIGYYSLLAARTARQVYAFELSPYSFRYLTLNILINHLTNVEAYPLALWDEPDEFGSADSSGNIGGNGIVNPRGGWRAVQAVTLDSMFASGIQIDMIKVDCEETDRKVLRGANRILNEWSPRLLIESPDKEYLTALGYKMQENLYSGQGPLEYWVKP